LSFITARKKGGKKKRGVAPRFDRQVSARKRPSSLAFDVTPSEPLGRKKKKKKKEGQIRCLMKPKERGAETLLDLVNHSTEMRQPQALLDGGKKKKETGSPQRRD